MVENLDEAVPPMLTAFVEKGETFHGKPITRWEEPSYKPAQLSQHYVGSSEMGRTNKVVVPETAAVDHTTVFSSATGSDGPAAASQQQQGSNMQPAQVFLEQEPTEEEAAPAEGEAAAAPTAGEPLVKALPPFPSAGVNGPGMNAPLEPVLAAGQIPAGAIYKPDYSGLMGNTGHPNFINPAMDSLPLKHYSDGSTYPGNMAEYDYYPKA